MTDSASPSVSKTQSTPELPIRVIGRLPLLLTDGERQEFERLSLELAAITRQHDAVISYSCNADIEDPGIYIFDEVWPSYEVFQRHLQTTHFKTWWAWVEPKLRGSLTIDYTYLANLTRL